MTTNQRPSTDLPLTPVTFLRRSATVFSDRVAVVDGTEETTYARWWERVQRMAGLIHNLGVRPGDRVAVLAPNTHMLLDSHFGVALAGGVLLTLNIRLTADELSWIAFHAEPSVLLYDESLAAVAEHLPVQKKISNVEYAQRLATAPALAQPVVDEYELIALNYTSGTTGRPRGVRYHHRGAHQQALAMAYHAGLGTDTVHLWTLPMFHCNGWAFTWAVTAAGGRHVCLPKVDAQRIWDLIRSQGVNSLNAAPTVLVDLAAHPSAAPIEGGVRVGIGGAPPSPALLSELGDLGFDVTHYYGLTETFGPAAVCQVPPDVATADVETQARFKSRQGNANIAGTPVRVLGPDGVDVAADGESIGEIAMTGNTIALGYYRDEEATTKSFGTGWFLTGDLGVMHPDGYIELRDRAKDVIISGGENISSVEVEQVLQAHPDILEAAVVAVPHPRWGEVPAAFVTAKLGATISEAEVVAHCREHLPGFKTPKRVLVGDLPKTGTGKVQKFSLRNVAAAESARDDWWASVD